MADFLREYKPSVVINKPPPDVRAAIVAVANGVASAQQQLRFWRFVVFELAGVSQLAMALPAEEAIQNWRAGCRYVGLFLEEMKRLPIDDPPPDEPPPRTMTERGRRRERTITQG